jgi:DNA-binding MarR family transcriptional regulator
MVAGNLAAGIVLYRLIFWKPTRTINGRPMFAKPRSELEFETGLTGKQVENALSRLRKMGLIQTGQHQFHGRNVMHVAVTATCHQALEETDHQSPQTGSLSPPEMVDTVPPNEGTSYTTYKQGGLHGGQQGDDEQSLVEGSEEDENLGSEGEPAVKKVRHSSVKDAIMNATKTSPEAGKKFHKPDSVKALELTWTKAVADATGKYVPPMTMKDAGLLKHFRTKCPPGKAEEVLRYAAENWIAFVKQVEADAGIKTTPAEPRLDFLLKHAGVAINMAAPPKSVPKAKQEAKPVGKKATKPVQLIATEDQPLSVEDALKILNEDD